MRMSSGKPVRKICHLYRQIFAGKTRFERLMEGERNGRGRIRTSEDISRQIYSLMRLATSLHARVVQSNR